MIIRINRIYGNADFTIGIATIDGYKFRAYTLERRSADHSRASNKRNNHAFPCGEYKFKFEPTRLSPLTPVSYLLKGFGRMTIKDVSSYLSLGTGDVAFFKKYPQEGTEEVVRDIYVAFENLCYKECVAEKRGDIDLFVITEADEFFYDEEWKMKHEPLFEDEDFIDEGYEVPE